MQNFLLGLKWLKKKILWFKTWLHQCSHFPHSMPSCVAAGTYNGYIVRQCIAQCGTISHVCFLTSALCPPGTLRLPVPATALSFLLPFCPTKALRIFCLWTAPFINTRQNSFPRDKGSSFLRRPKASCPYIWWLISSGQGPPSPPQAPERLTWPSNSHPPISAFIQRCGDRTKFSS